MRILVTGSRDWRDVEGVRAAILDALSGQPGTDHTIIHGAAIGADSIADAVARQLGLKIEAYPALWSQHQDNCSKECRSERRCKRAGYVRNAKMVAAGADICLAFIKDESRGASMCAKLAEDADIPTRRYIQ